MAKTTNETGLSKLDEFYSDIIVTAVEGGIGYWSRCSEYVHGWGNDLDGPRTAASVTVHELVEEQANTYSAGIKVTTKDIAKAMRRATKAPTMSHTSDEWRKRMARALREKDAYNIDAGDADAIMQIAVLGAIVYG